MKNISQKTLTIAMVQMRCVGGSQTAQSKAANIATALQRIAEIDSYGDLARRFLL